MSSWASSRLAAIRAELIKRGLDGVIIPRFDAHQGEYCAPHDERLAYATGFSGSAGVALVLAERAVIFVDGRYQTQVRNEVDLTAFEIDHFFDHPLEQWLAENAGKGQRIGFNAMLVPVSWQQKFAAALQARGADLVSLDGDIVDAVWPDQPPAPSARVEAFPLAYAGQSSAEKRQAVAGRIARAGADFLVETQPDNIAWLLNVRGADVSFNPIPHSFLIIGKDGSVEWFVDERKLPNALDDYELDGVSRLAPERFIDRVQARGEAGKGHLDPDFTSSAVALALNGEFVAGKSPITLIKSVKNQTELEGFRTVHVTDGVAVTRYLHWLHDTAKARAQAGRPVDEREAQDVLRDFRADSPTFTDLSFASISAAAGNAAMSHYNALKTEERTGITLDAAYLIDSGGQYFQGTTDVTRTTALGAVSFEFRRAYTAVLKGFISMITLRFPRGTQGHQIDAFARRYLWDLGLDYDHGTGHGVGHFLSVHEGPNRFAKVVNPYPIEPGMVLTIEPGYYEAGRLGIRIENQVEVIDGGRDFLQFESLTLAPIDVSLALPERLTPTEIAWLDTYHDRVRRELEPRLSGPARDWLIKATEKIGAKG